MDAQLRQILADVFGLQPAMIREELTAEEIRSWDSLKHLQLVTALEQTYGITLDTDEISEIRGVKDIIETLHRHEAL